MDPTATVLCAVCKEHPSWPAPALSVRPRCQYHAVYHAAYHRTRHQQCSRSSCTWMPSTPSPPYRSASPIWQSRLPNAGPPPPPPPPRGAGAAADEAEMEAAGRCCYCGEGAVVACVAGACGHVCCYYCVGSAIKSNRRECPRCGGPLFESPTRWAPPSAAPTSLPTV
eukprot:TRINITY_DN1645_c1_g3_i1.p2 TRINITY_DN1645_c1_g3~~TRINITY_DN1645_c1_g3_i1.p2  ORF type:complete len:191 (+),score=59.44 TRINITY_DN1645_c1_g3_i1:72-575(+)